MSEPERIILTVKGRDYPGTVRRRYPDGYVYVILDCGSQGNYPEASLRPYEDKDFPGVGIEVK